MMAIVKHYLIDFFFQVLKFASFHFIFLANNILPTRFDVKENVYSKEFDGKETQTNNANGNIVPNFIST